MLVKGSPDLSVPCDSSSYVHDKISIVQDLGFSRQVGVVSGNNDLSPQRILFP